MKHSVSSATRNAELPSIQLDFLHRVTPGDTGGAGCHGQARINSILDVAAAGSLAAEAH
jgi:hypothetical protein